MEFILNMIEGSEGAIAFIIFFMNMMGVFLKNKTKIKNDYIPLILFLVGLIFGFFIIEMSLYGILSGAICAFTATGVHQGFKTTKHVIVGENTTNENQIKDTRIDDDIHDKI